MDSLIVRLDLAKELMATAEKLFNTDYEESTIVAKAAEAILKRVNQGFSDIIEKRTISLTDYESLLAGTSPNDADAEDAEDALTTTGFIGRRNFTQWAKTLNLQTGHLIYFGDVPFRLAISKRATLTAQTRSGKIIVGYSPSGAIKAYLKSIGSLQTNVDGWKRMTMAYKGDYKPIGWPDWLLYVWSPEQKEFV